VHAIDHEIREELGPEATLASVRHSSLARPGTHMDHAAQPSTSPTEWAAHFGKIEERIERLEKTVGTAVGLLHEVLLRERSTKPGARR
jgi:hypothetical protein